MKLFTKEIDQKLFAQYSKGSDLSNQMVVAKIFNPYGRGTWYLINSDEDDPDYLWAIVDLFEVEVGSVSRKELESIKIKPFNFGLERDLSFTPRNAEEVFKGLLSGKTYAKGGKLKYDPSRDVVAIVIKDNNFNMMFKKGDFLGGAYQMEKGGSLENYTYVSPRKIIFARLKSGEDIKPINGFYIRKDASGTLIFGDEAKPKLKSRIKSLKISIPRPILLTGSPSKSPQMMKFIGTFSGKDLLRPAMTFVQIKEGSIVATDAHKLIRIIDGSTLNEDKLVCEAAKCKTQSEDQKFPSVSHVTNSIDSEFSESYDMVDLYESLMQVRNDDLKNKLSRTLRVIELKLENQTIYFNITLLLECVKGCLLLGWKKAFISYSQGRKAIVFTEEKAEGRVGEVSLILLMPIFSDSATEKVTITPKMILEQGGMMADGGEVVIPTTYLDYNPDYLVGTNTMYEMFEHGGRLKGRNNETGESFGVVIGSAKKYDEGFNLVIRKSYGARIQSFQFRFDENGNLKEILDYGYSVDGIAPDTKGDSGSGRSIFDSNKSTSLKEMGKLTSPAFAKKLYDFVQEQMLGESSMMAKGGYVDLQANLMKELQKLQRDLNSPRLSRYTEGDNSQEEMARQRERASKLARFNEILDLLRELESKKMADGGVMDDISEVKKYAIVDENTDRIYIRNTNKEFIDLKYKELKEIYPNDKLSIIEFEKGGIMAEGGFVAMYNGKKINIEADSLYAAKLKAIEEFKVPKSKQGLLSVVSNKSLANQDFRFMANGGIMAKGGRLLTTRERYIQELKGLATSLFEGLDPGDKFYNVNFQYVPNAGLDPNNPQDEPEYRDDIDYSDYPIHIRFLITRFIEDYNLSDDEILNAVIGLGRRQINIEDFLNGIDPRVDPNYNNSLKELLAFIKSDEALRQSDGDYGKYFAKGGKIREFDDVLIISKNKLGMVEAIADNIYYVTTPFGESFEAALDDLQKVKSFSKGGAMEHMILLGDKVLDIYKNVLIVQSVSGGVTVIDFRQEPIARRILVERITGKNTLASAKEFIDTDPSFNNYVSKEAIEIARLTATRPDAVQKFVDTHNLNIDKLYKFLKKENSKSRFGGFAMDFVTALVGRDGNPNQKKMIKMFQESVNQKMAMGGSLQGHGLEVGDLIVEDLGGYIRVVSEDGKDFFITLKTGDRETEAPLPFKHGGKVKHLDVTRLATKTNEAGDEVVDLTEFYEGGGNVPKVFDVPAQFLDAEGKRKNDKKTIKELTDFVLGLPQTKSIYYNDNLGGYTPSRKKLHAEIINKFKKEVVCINNDKPIAIFMGGSPASGKSTFLRKYSPFLLKEEILKIDADEIRAILPEYEGWNAAQTHLETRDIVNTLLSNKNIGIPCDFDIIYDGTMNSVKSYIPLMDILRKRGYKIFIVFMDNVPKDVIIKRALDRYKSSGRFVPLEVIEDFFTKGKSAFNELKKDVDGYMRIDGSSQDYKVLEEGGMKLPRDREYSKLGTKIKASDIPISYKKGGLSLLY